MLLNIPHDLADLLYGLLILRNVFFSDPHRIVHQYLYEIRLDRICRDLQHPEARIMELLPKHGCENYKSVSRLFKERYGCSMKEMQKRYEKEKGDRPMGQWVRIKKAEMP